ncbi:MAG: CoA pyrophosphatase [Pseudomonadota bacterium]
MLDLADLTSRCDDDALQTLSERRCAAVALMFADGADGLEMCFVKRKEYPGDPWSGQMALPGGKRTADDGTPHAVAVREVSEEVGVDLSSCTPIGMLPRMTAGAGGLRDPLPVYPVLYRIEGPGPLITLGDELAEGHWIALSHLWDRQNWSSLQWRGSRFAGIAHGERIIWGFTLSVLTRLSEIAGRSIRGVYD